MTGHVEFQLYCSESLVANFAYFCECNWGPICLGLKLSQSTSHLFHYASASRSDLRMIDFFLIRLTESCEARSFAVQVCFGDYCSFSRKDPLVIVRRI